MSYAGYSLQTVETPPRSEHLVRSSLPDWAFWRWAGVRAAGFPASLVNRLAGAACARAADGLFQAEESLASVQNHARAELSRQLADQRDESKRKALARIVKQVENGILPAPEGIVTEPWYVDLAKAHSATVESNKCFCELFQKDVFRIAENVRQISADPKFRQAVLLQNRKAFRNVTQAFAHQASKPEKRGFKERQNLELIANYLQRYCLKNDTIGFFGPLGWAKLTTDRDGVTVSPGAHLVETSEVYFENWCIESLADCLSHDPSLRPWMCPRLSPLLYLESNRLYSPGGIVSHLAAHHATVVAKCNGEKTARQIALEVVSGYHSELRSEAQVFEVLALLVSRKVIAWRFEVPLHPHPEQILAALLDRVEDKTERLTAIAALAELQAARAKVENAIGDVEQLDEALGELDRTFTRLTEKAPSRAAGAMYAGRTLVYQDCRRDLELEIGGEVIRSLEKPLSLLLMSARWLSYRAAAAYRTTFLRVFESLCRRNRTAQIDFVQFWLEVEAITIDSAKHLFRKILPDFQGRWNAILNVQRNASRVEYNSESLLSQVEAAFAVPRAGWQLARYHSPDVMIAASSVDALRKGDYFLVLGEIHITANTLRQSFSVAQHPASQELIDAGQRDHPAPRVIPVPPRNWPRLTNRTAVSLCSPVDYRLEVSQDSISPGPRSKTFPISAFVVQQSGQDLVVRSRDRKLSFDIIEFCGEILSGQATEFVKILCPDRHTPRISIDRLTIIRESWSVQGNELRFINRECEHERYREARRWMKQLGLPRFTFAKAAVEVKPFYVDWESPIYVEIFIKMVRRHMASNRAEEPILISEMLPSPDQLWLPDADGNLYTSELRIVVRDMVE